MTITEAILIFAGIPAVVVAAVYAAVYGMSGRRSDKRYRPGRPFTFAPVWFLASPREASEVARTAEAARDAPAVTVSGAKPVLVTGTAAEGDPEGAPVQRGETGGASDSW